MVLSGWKEIASYLHCGVRTVQRWEGAGLPIHRPAIRTRGHVFAHSDELDGWIRRKRVSKPQSSTLLASITNAKKLQGETYARLLELQRRVGRLQYEVADMHARRQRHSALTQLVQPS